MTAPAQTPLCACLRAEALWIEEELMSVALRGAVLETDLVDRITPGRARLVVGLALAAGAQLEHGDRGLFEQAVKDAGPGVTGWWRQALGMPARSAVARQRTGPFPAAVKAANAK